jgi:peptidoglycan/LPS O-acetylase OafA/YrhL
MMTAYVFHTNQDGVPKLLRRFNNSLWLSSISIIFAIIAGIFPFQERNKMTSKFMNAFFIAASHLGWSLSVSWIIFACHSGTGGFVNSFLSLRVWKPLARIGLSIYLTHILAILAIFGTQKQPEYFNEFLKTHLFIGDLGLSFGVAVLAYLTFEASVLSIEKSFHSEKNEK